MRRVVRLCVLYVLEALAALTALAIFAGGAVLWRLAAGPVEVDALRPAASAALAEAFAGDQAEIGRLTARFDPGSATLVIEAADVRVLGRGGETLARARAMDAALALDALLVGRVAPVRVGADGGALAVVRRADGSIAAGFGSAERLLAGDGAAAPQSAPDMTGLRAAFREVRGGPLSRLREIDIRDVQIRVIDARSDLDWIFNDARAVAAVGEGELEADFSGLLLTSAGAAPVAIDMRTGAELEEVFVDARISGLVPAAAAPRRGLFAHLGRIDAPVALDVVLDASREAGLRAVLVEIDAGAGTVRVGGGQAATLNSAGLLLAFDTREGEIRLERAELDSDAGQASATGRIYNFSRFENAIPGRAAFEFALTEGRAVLPGLFEGPLEWGSLEAEGVLRPFDLAAELDRFALDFSGGLAAFSGETGLARTGAGLRPYLRLDGGVDGAPVKSDVLGWWPPRFADGARDWVSRSILEGELADVTLSVDIPASVFETRTLTDEMLDLRFRFIDADVLYMATMTPLLGLSGEARLQGNSLSLSGAGGAIGDMQVDTIFVEIPELARGAIMRFGGTGETELGDLIALLEQPPLRLPGRYGVEAEAFEGRGSIEFEILRPMLSSVPAEDLGYAFSGDFTGVGGPTGLGALRFEQGVVEVSADTQGLEAMGVARIAGAQARLRWTEAFNAGEGADSTRIEIASTLDARALDRMGLPLRRFLDGPVGLQATLQGRGFDFAAVDAEFDLADAAIAAPAEVWSKAPGEPAAASIAFGVEDDGVVRIERVRAEARGARLDASASLDASGRLLSARIDDVFVDGLMDLTGGADRPGGPEGALRLTLEGPYLDARPFLDQARRTGLGGDGSGADVIIQADVDRVGVRGAEVSDVALNLILTPDGLSRLDFQASGPQGLTRARVEPEPVEDGAPARVVEVRSPDAGLFLSAITGYGNASGGELRLDARAAALGEDGGMTGDLSVSDFRLEQMPFLARVLAAGSLQGLADLLGGGGGIDFETLEADFRWSEGVLEMREARAAGPSLGATWQGVVDFAQARVAVDGTLLPSYGVNSALSGVPVIGGILSSRPGEGVIGLTFSAEGPFSATRVFANPLSALAPGVFRRIFEGTSAEREFEALEARRQAEGAPETEPGTSTEPPPQPAGENGPDGP